MLQIMMYHRVGEGKHSNSFDMMQNHLDYIAKTFPTVLPGDDFRRGKRSVCLTFDDASYDFYVYVYPLLRKFNLRALLAVPTQYITETTNQSAETRLSVPYFEAMNNEVYAEKAPFCTWEELREMLASGHVELASHGHRHVNMTNKVDVEGELRLSKELLEDHTRQFISSFVYPFGRANKKVHAEVMKHYAYGMRIGGAMNRSWDCLQTPLCRIVGDNLSKPKEPFLMMQIGAAYLKSFVR
ncbi:Uncharacterized protein SCG7109_AB_00170 [Chlamydiales bacterium SCGC AG-110-M15]|nr:Uncharacterized protein SCG7109_AB_00170 [Chlamydiales bacterium SCGC AG-110-M15]